MLKGNQGTTLLDAARLASWPTPTASSATGAGGQSSDVGKNLQTIASWATPSARDWKDTPGMSITREAGRLRLDQLPRQAQLAASGRALRLSAAEIKSCGPLNPAHSRWLMGYPIAWDDCAPMATRSSRSSRRSS